MEIMELLHVLASWTFWFDGVIFYVGEEEEVEVEED